MKLLLKAALLNRKHYLLLILTLCAMFMMTIASQMEMLSLGVIAKTGPDFFSLFAEKGQVASELTLNDVAAKWNDVAGGEILTRERADAYLAKSGGQSLIQRLTSFLDRHFSITRSLAKLSIILVFVAMFKAASLFSHRYFTQLVSIRVSRDLRQHYFEHIQSLPMSFYQEHHVGALAARVGGDAGIVASSINSMLLNYVSTPFAVISTLTACFFISWQLSLIVFIGFPLVLLPVIIIAKKIKKIAKEMQRNQEGFSSSLLDFLSGIMTVKVFAMEDFSLKKYCEQNNTMAKLEERSARYGLASRPILHMFSSLFFAAVVLTGLYIFGMTPVDLLVFCSLLYMFYEPIKKFSEENNTIFRGVAAAERMYEVLELKSTIIDAPDAIELKGFEREIEFKNVTFRYKDDLVLKDLSFTVKKGETIAIVGPTGAGKSTIVSLLPRLYDVEKGAILIDGKPLQSFTQKSLREHIAFVPQKPFLFMDTVRENICFGRSFSHEEVVKAAQRAHAEEFIVNLPGGYDALVSESGKNLSGGQQQRLAVARALVKKAPILVMDEATSSLDAISERKIRDALMGLRGSITQIIIAHRFSTIEHADKIIYLENGRKIAEGNRQTLLQICPNFRRMWEMMQSKESDESVAMLSS